MLADGSNGSVELLENSIVIRRKGFANKLTQGWQGDKTVPLRSITAVQFRPAGTAMGGYIQFTLLGGQEFRGGMRQVTMDENAVIFTAQQQPAFEALRDVVQEAIEAPSREGPGIASNLSEELSRLADLVDKGYLTRDEFDAQKQTLLSGGRRGSPARARAQAIARASATESMKAPPPARTSRAKYVIAGLVGLVILATQTGRLLPDPPSPPEAVAR